MANGEIIMVLVTEIGPGNTDVKPTPIAVLGSWMLNNPAPRTGVFSVFIDPALNRNQREAALAAGIAAIVTEETGEVYAANDVHGITL